MLSAAELRPHARRVVSEIVRLLTPRRPILDEATRYRVHHEVVDFVASQIRALPDFLRWPYLGAIIAFDVLGVLHGRRRFLALPEEAKAAHLTAWSEGRIGAFRNFVKLIRGCALLAYYDHPAVAAALETERKAALAARTAPAAGGAALDPPAGAAAAS